MIETSSHNINMNIPPSMNPSSSILSARMLLVPAASLGFFYVAKLRSAIRLELPDLDHNSPQRSRTIAIWAAVLVLSYVAELSTYLASIWKGGDPASAQVVACLTTLLFYCSLTYRLALGEEVIWQHCIGTFMSTLVFQAIDIAVNRSNSSTFAAIQTAKLGALLACILLVRQYNTERLPESVCKQLQAQRAARKINKTKDEFDSDFDSDDSEPEVQKEQKEQRQKRLREAGNWFTFIEPYKIFIPMLFPVGQPRLQLCVVFLLLEIAMSRLFGLMVPRYMGIITEKLMTGGTSNFPWRDVIIWATLTLCQSDVFCFFRQYTFLPLEQYARKQLSMCSFEHVMSLSMDFHHDKSSSDLIRVVEQGQAITDILTFLCFDMAPLFIDTTIAIVYVATTFDAYMAFIVVSGGLMYIWLRTQVARWAIASRKAYNTSMREESKVQYEALSNWSTVSQFNRENYEVKRYSEHIDRHTAAWTEMNAAYNRTDFPILSVTQLLATTLAMYRVSQGLIPLGELITFTAIYHTIMSPITSVSWMVRRMQSLLTDSERLLVLLQTKRTICDAPDAKKLDLKRGKIEFEHVSFAYDPRKPTLTDISFTAKPGSTVAFVGETGGGKSTIMKMLYRYYDVGSGSIKIDGQDIRNVQLDSLRDAFGFVPQNPALFNMTILENLRYARLDATDEEIEGACRAACIHDKIMQFPDKYQSKVGERGVKLSGGEMQRVAIARAILRDPKIVLLDEATSQIDALTEAHIQEALKRLTSGRTTFVIAHRLSTIQHADLIVVVENGKIVEQGNHDELRKLGGRYVALWSRQMSKGQMNEPEIKSRASTPVTSVSSDDGYETDSD